MDSLFTASLSLLTSWEDSDGALFLFEPRPGVFLSEAVGRLGDGAGHLYSEVGTEIFAKVPPGKQRRVFNDWHRMAGYSSASRQELTLWSKRTMQRGDRADFIITAPLVSMGVTTASLALQLIGIDIVNHKTRASFLQEMQRG